jgi:hypothetical protein
MKNCATLLLAVVLLLTGHPTAASDRLGWSRELDSVENLPPDVTSALDAVRRLGTWLSDAINVDMDTGMEAYLRPGDVPLSFDPTRHLAYGTYDLNGDERPDVLFLFQWTYLSGNNPSSMGVVMINNGPDRWEFGCEFYDYGSERKDDDHPWGYVDILPPNGDAWRSFVTADGFYFWEPDVNREGRREC